MTVREGRSRGGPTDSLVVTCDVEDCDNWCIPVRHSTGIPVPSWPRWSTVIAMNRARVDICPLHEMPIPIAISEHIEVPETDAGAHDQQTDEATSRGGSPAGAPASPCKRPFDRTDAAGEICGCEHPMLVHDRHGCLLCAMRARLGELHD